MLLTQTQIRYLLGLTIVGIVFMGIVSCADAVCCSKEKCTQPIEEDTVVELVMDFR